MDITWILNNLVAPIIVSIMGIATAVLVPLGIKYLNRRWKLDIDDREQKKVEQLAADTVHLIEASVRGGTGIEKMAEAKRALVMRATEAGIDIGEDVARAKLERALTTEGIRSDVSTK